MQPFFMPQKDTPALNEAAMASRLLPCLQFPFTWPKAALQQLLYDFFGLRTSAKPQIASVLRTAKNTEKAAMVLESNS